MYTPHTAAVSFHMTHMLYTSALQQTTRHTCYLWEHILSSMDRKVHELFPNQGQIRIGERQNVDITVVLLQMCTRSIVGALEAAELRKHTNDCLVWAWERASLLSGTGDWPVYTRDWELASLLSGTGNWLVYTKVLGTGQLTPRDCPVDTKGLPS